MGIDIGSKILYILHMRLFCSPWLLMFSQALVVTGVGWIQWNWLGSVTLTFPLCGLVFALYSHQLWLYKRNALPERPRDIRIYWGIALGWSLMMMILFVLTQSSAEVARVGKILPILWLGVGLMDWVLLVCTQQLIGQQWGE